MNKKINTIVLLFVVLTESMPLFAATGYAEIIEFKAKEFFGSGYSLYATIKSSDKDCGHYVDWWEAVSEDGKLLYRRTLAHPHSSEQPFSRGGSARNINKDIVFYVRAHLYPDGYSNKGMKGSIKTGFTSVIIPDGFAADLAKSGNKSSRCNPNLD